MFKADDFLELNSRFITNCKPFLKIITLFLTPALIYALVLLCFFGYLPLKIELHTVVLIGVIFFIYLFFIPHNAYFVSCKFKNSFEDLKEKLLIYTNNNLLTIDESIKANGSAEDFLKDYTSSLRNSNFSNIASGIFPSLGILGTFISIALTMPDFTSSSTAVLDMEITKLLGGVATAFYVSIYGIFLSIWWIFFEKFGISRFEKDSFIIKDSTKKLFWTKIDIESIHIKSNIDNFSKINDIFKELTSSKVMQTLNESIEQRFDNLERVLEKEQNLSSKLDKNISNFENLLSSAESLNYKIRNQNDVFMDMSKELNKNIVELNSHMNNLSSENLKAIYTNIVKSIETMKSDIDKIEWKYKEGLKESLKQIDEQTTSIVKNLSIFKDLSK